MSSSRFVYNDVSEFKLKEKLFSLSGDSFKIKNAASDEVAFKVDGKVLSIRDAKTISDADGNKVYKMTEKLVSLRHRSYIQDADSGAVLYTIRQKNYIQLFKGTMQVWAGDDDEGDPVFEITGNVLRKNFTIVDKQRDCDAAVISKKLLNLTTIFTEGDVYVVRVNPGYDTALMVFLAIIIDEQFHDDE